MRGGPPRRQSACERWRKLRGRLPVRLPGCVKGRLPMRQSGRDWKKRLPKRRSGRVWKKSRRDRSTLGSACFSNYG